MEERESLVERGLRSCLRAVEAYKIPLLTALLVGLAAHGFAFANKLVCADEAAALFSKGADLDSGRWLLGATSLLFPDVSMPWLYGLLSLCFYAAAACLTIYLFEIKNPFLQGLLAAIFVCLPSTTSLYCYFFTAMPYVLALVLAIASVCVGRREGRLPFALSVLLLLLSLGIYQAYVAVAASFYLLLMIRMLLRGEEETKRVLLFGLRALGMLALALLLYYGIHLLVLRVSGHSPIAYSQSEYSLGHRFLLTYNALLKAVIKGYFGLVPRPLSRIVHIAGAAGVLLALLRWFVKNRDPKRTLLLALCLALLPLSMNCLFLVANVTVIHAITLYSFVFVYVLAIVVVETLEGKAARLGKDALITGLALVVLVNVVFANEVYLKLQLEYENAFATWTEIVTQIKLTEGFDEDTRIALVGKGTEHLYQPDEIDTGDLLGPTDDLVNIYTRDALLRHYLGFDADFLSREDAWLLSLDARVEDMPLYPYPGSVRKIDDVIGVKFGERG